MAYIDKDKIPYYLDTSEEAPMEGRKIAFKSDIDKIPPADVLEVVRCKDCGSYNTHYGECTLNGSHYGENGYCCKGKRTPQKEEAVEDRTEEAFSLIQTAMKRGGEK